MRKPSVKEDLPLHVRSLYRYALALTRDGEEAHDLVQDCCTAALDNEHQFERGTNLRAWLFTILHNRHVSRERKRRRAGEHVAFSDFTGRLIHPSNQMARLEFRDLIAAISELDSEFREVLVLVSVEGLSYKEVADILGVPVGTVTSRLSRARSMLRQRMDRSNEPRGTAPPVIGLRIIR